MRKEWGIEKWGVYLRGEKVVSLKDSGEGFEGEVEDG